MLVLHLHVLQNGPWTLFDKPPEPVNTPLLLIWLQINRVSRLYLKRLVQSLPLLFLMPLLLDHGPHVFLDPALILLTHIDSQLGHTLVDPIAQVLLVLDHLGQ